jgi:chromosome segregation protein
VEIDREATGRFLTAFEQVQDAFQEFFVRLFDGGSAELALTDKDNVLECGIDVTVTVPGKKTRDLLQLSGGERALTAAAILFSLLKVKPSPFVILDEVDAPICCATSPSSHSSSSSHTIRGRWRPRTCFTG